MWDVEPETSDLNMTLNAMTHLNLLEDIVPLVQPSSDAASTIPGSATSIHDVDVQVEFPYADYEDVDPFQDL